MKKAFFLNILYLLFSACGQTNGVGPNRINSQACREVESLDANGHCIYSPSDETIQDVLLDAKYIKDTLDKMPICEKGVEHEDCELIKVVTSDEDLRWQDADEKSKIMVIESGLAGCHFEKKTSEGRYKHRIIGRYMMNTEGRYESCQSSSLLPRGWVRLMHERPGAYRYIPSKPIGDAFDEDIYRHFPESIFRFDHGNPVLSILADYNPQATFILAESVSEKSYILCSGSFEDIRRFYKQSFESLRDIILSEGVRYINYSAGVTEYIAKISFEDKCSPLKITADRHKLIMEVEHQWMRDMSSIPGVVFVQAGVNFGGHESFDSCPIDCITEGTPNRVRVGGFSDVRDFIGDNGVGFNSVADSVALGTRMAKDCIDLFINFGVPSDVFNYTKQSSGLRPVEISDEFYTYPIHYMMTVSSFAAPVALSYIINAVNKGGDLDDIPALLRKITSEGNLPMHDPVRNGNLESFRLRKAWYWDSDSSILP